MNWLTASFRVDVRVDCLFWVLWAAAASATTTVTMSPTRDALWSA